MVNAVLICCISTVVALNTFKLQMRIKFSCVLLLPLKEKYVSYYLCDCGAAHFFQMLELQHNQSVIDKV